MQPLSLSSLRRTKTAQKALTGILPFLLLIAVLFCAAPQPGRTQASASHAASSTIAKTPGAASQQQAATNAVAHPPSAVSDRVLPVDTLTNNTLTNNTLTNATTAAIEVRRIIAAGIGIAFLLMILLAFHLSRMKACLYLWMRRLAAAFVLASLVLTPTLGQAQTYAPLVTDGLTDLWQAKNWTGSTIPNESTGSAATVPTGGSPAYTGSPTYSATNILSQIPALRVVDDGTTKTGITLPRNLSGSFTILVAAREAAGSGISAFFLSGAAASGAGSADNFNLYFSDRYGFNCTSGNTVSGTFTTDYPETGLYLLWSITYDATAKTLKIGQDGRTFQARTLTTNLTFPSGIRLGGPQGGPAAHSRRTNAYFSVALMYNRVLSDQEIRLEGRNIAQGQGSTLTKVSWFGNSHFVGAGATNISNSAMRLTQSYLTGLGRAGMSYYEDAVTGRSTQEMFLRANNTGSGARLLYPYNLAFFTEDTNTYTYDTIAPYTGITGAENQQITRVRHAVFLEELYRAGYNYVVDMTTLNRAPGDAAGWRNAVNTFSANYGSSLRAIDGRWPFSYRQMPAGETSPLTDATNPTYFNAAEISQNGIGTHLNDSGNTQLANLLMKPYALQALFPASASVLTTATGITNTTATGFSWTAHGTSPSGGTVTDQLQWCYEGTGDWQNVSGATSSPADITGLLAGYNYWIRVKHVDSNDPNNPFYSNIVKVTTTGTDSNTAATITGVTMNSDGRTFTFTFSRPVKGDTGTQLFVNGSAKTRWFVTRPTATTLKAVLAVPALAGDTITYKYADTGVLSDIKNCVPSGAALTPVTTATTITNTSTCTVGSVTLYGGANNLTSSVISTPIGLVRNGNGTADGDWLPDQTAVTFAVSPNAGTLANSNINQNGYYLNWNYTTPAQSSNTTTYVVTATSTADVSKAGSINFTVLQESVKPVVNGTPTVNAAGNLLTINFTEAGSPPVSIPASGVTMSGGHTLSGAARPGATQLTFVISPALVAGESVTYSITAGAITDSAGTPNGILAVTNAAVNTSAVTNTTGAALVPLRAGRNSARTGARTAGRQ